MHDNPHFAAAESPEALMIAWEIRELRESQHTGNLISYMENNPSAVILDRLDVTVRDRLGLSPDPMGVKPHGTVE